MEGLSFLAARRRGPCECGDVFDDTEGGERLINHRPVAVRWGSGSGIDPIMLHALPFWLICGFLQSRSLPRVSILTPSAANHVPGSYFDCIWSVPLGGTVEAAVRLCVIVHFSLPSEPMRHPGEHED